MKKKSYFVGKYLKSMLWGTKGWMPGPAVEH